MSRSARRTAPVKYSDGNDEAPSKKGSKKNTNALKKALIEIKTTTRAYPTNITNYIKAGIKPEKGKNPMLLNSYYKGLNALIVRMQAKAKKEARTGYHPNVNTVSNLSSLSKHNNNGNNRNNANSFSNSQIKNLKSIILQKIYKTSLTQSDKKPFTVLYKFFDDMYLPQVRKFSRFISNDALLNSYIQNATAVIRAKTTKEINRTEIPIIFSKKQLITFVVLMWLDSIHDGYYEDTLIKALYDDTSSIFLKHLDILTRPVRLELIGTIQANWQKITVLQQLAENKLIDVLPKNGKTDFGATSGKFEAFLKNNISRLFGADPPLILGHTKLMTADIPIRINLAIDQGDGRIPDTLLASQYAKIPDNKLSINSTLTIAGLVDPGRFFLIQRMGYTSLLSGLFNIDNPSINGKIVMDDIKFGFYYKSNKNNSNNRRQHLFTANYNVEPRTTGGSTIDIITLNLSNKNGAVQLRPGTTAKEGDITKFFGDFYQVLINNAYNIDRKGGSYYTLASGDGVMIAMNTFISGVMGAPLAMFVDSGKLTELGTNQTQPVKFYFPKSLSSHLHVISDVQSPTLTKQSNANKNNNKNNAVSSNRRVVYKKPPTPRVNVKRPLNINKNAGVGNSSSPVKRRRVAWATPANMNVNRRAKTPTPTPRRGRGRPRSAAVATVSMGRKGRTPVSASKRGRPQSSRGRSGMTPEEMENIKPALTPRSTRFTRSAHRTAI
jgi:hypothetical protein